MSEAKEGSALLEDIDEHTFVRFSQYAYTGDYATPDPEILLDASVIATTSTLDETPPDPTKEAIEAAPADTSIIIDDDG